MNYLAVDEWSVVPLSRDLTGRTRRAAPDTPRVDALPVSYADYAAWATEVLAAAATTSSRTGAPRLAGLPG